MYFTYENLETLTKDLIETGYTQFNKTVHVEQHPVNGRDVYTAFIKDAYGASVRRSQGFHSPAAVFHALTNGIINWK